MNLIFATAEDGLFGKNGHLPWKCKEDLQHFNRITVDTFLTNTIIMGRKTWESLPAKLPNRHNVVIGKGETKPGYDAKYSTLAEFVFPTDNSQVFIIGGKALIADVLANYREIIDNIYYTIIGADYLIAGLLDTDNVYLDFNIADYDLVQKNEQISVKFYQLKINNQERQYLELLKRTIRGDCRDTRNAKTLSIFGENLSFDLTRGFPLLTTKKMFMRGIFEELMLFIRGQTDSKILEAKGVNIWKGNTSTEFIAKSGLPYQEGDMGPMYGFNWSHFGADYIDCKTDYTGKGHNQLADVLDLLENDPTSRRILLTDYNPCTAKLGVLYPCHSIIIQFYINGAGQVSMNMYQRSVDEFLGLPFNIASSALFLHLICATLNARAVLRDSLPVYRPFKLNILMGDCHVYKSHIEAVKKQLTRVPYTLPTINIKQNSELDRYEWQDVEILNYKSHPAIKAEMVA